MQRASWAGDATVRFAWELAEPPDGGPIQLYLLPTAPWTPDEHAALAIEEARRLTHQRSGGWRAPHAERTVQLLPWHTNLSPEQHAWVWIKLLQPFALSPDVTGPKLGRRGP